MHGAAGSAWRAAAGHCSGCDRVVVPVRPPFSLSPARLALWAGVSLGALVMFGGVVLWLALRNYRAVCSNCSLGVSLGALATFSGIALWPALGFILWRNCRAVLPGLRSWSHGRERRVDPGVPYPVGRRCCLFPGRPLGDVPLGAAAGLVVHLVDVRLKSVCWALPSGILGMAPSLLPCLSGVDFLLKWWIAQRAFRCRRSAARWGWVTPNGRAVP